MPAPIVFFDIAGPQSAHLNAFYQSVFDWQVGEGGIVQVPLTPQSLSSASLQGALRQDPAEKVIYIGVEDVSATLALIEEQGGSVEQPRFEVPGVVVLGLFRDPAGNRIGLVEMENQAPKIP